MFGDEEVGLVAVDYPCSVSFAIELNALLTAPRRCCCSLFELSMFIRFLFAFDLLFNLFRIAWCSSAWKELSSWFPLVLFLFHAILIVGVSFPFGVWGRMWNVDLYRFLIIVFSST